MKNRVDGKRIFKKITAAFLGVTMLFNLTGYMPFASAAETMESLKAKIDAAEAEYEAAVADEEANLARVGLGSLGFIDYMLEKKDLTDKQVFDLTRARTVIVDATNEDFSKWYGGDNTGLPESRNNKVTVTGDRYDAISLDNTAIIFDDLRAINDFRENDDIYVGSLKRNPAYTNFYFMAVAQTGADRAAGLRRHSSLTVSCECLAFGLGVGAWYSEKGSFKYAMEELGLSELGSESDIRTVENKADELNREVGHYTNLFWAKDQVMGVGFSNYKGTLCYNASSSSNYSSKYALYTIDEFEELYDEYAETVDPKAFAEKTGQCKARLEELKQQYYELCPSHSFGESFIAEPDCVNEGYTGRTCSICGYVEKTNIVPALGHELENGICSRCGLKTVYSLSYPNWRVSSNATYATDSLALEEGRDIPFSISFRSANEYGLFEEFVVDISDTSVLEYVPESNSTGTMKTLKPGLATVTVYAVNNPALKRVVTVDVTDVGGHTYKVTGVKNLDDGTKAVVSKCSGCGREITESVPRLTGKIYCSSDNSSFSDVSSSASYSIEAEKTLYIEYLWEKYNRNAVMDVNQMVFESSDESVLKFESMTMSSSYCKALFDVYKPGVVELKAYLKYDPDNVKTLTIDVADVGGHTYVISPAKEPAEETSAVCAGCGRRINVKIPTIGRVYYLNEEGTAYTYNSSYPEKNLYHAFAAGKDTSIRLLLSNKQNYTGMDNNEIIVESSDDDIIKFTDGEVDKYYSRWNGNFTCGKTGVAELSFYPKYNPSSKITVKAVVTDDTTVKVSKVSLSCADGRYLILGKNEKAKIDALVEPENASVKELVWMSSKPAVATVDSKGNITAKSKGFTCIYADAIDGSDVSGSMYFYVYEQQDAPSVAKSDFKVTENSIESSLSGNYQYRINKNGTWGAWTSYGKFTRLEADTEYEIAVRFGEDSSSYLAASSEIVLILKTPGHAVCEYGAQEPGCTSYGYTAGKKCSVCGKVFESPQPIEPTGHSWKKGKVTVEGGYKYASYSCDKCDGSFCMLEEQEIGTSDRAIVFSGSHETASYSVSPSGVLNVSSTGVIDVIKPGEATVSVKMGKSEFAIKLKAVPAGNAVSAGETFTVKFEDGRTKRWYSFTPDKDGAYFISSAGEYDTNIAEYDADGNMTGSNDDYDNGYNFGLSFYGKAGKTYYFALGTWQNRTDIEYEVTLKKDESRFHVETQCFGSADKPINCDMPADGVYSGLIYVNVECEDVCMVLYSTDGGRTYSRAAYRYYYNDGTYVYSLNIQKNTKIAIVKAGDFNLDGTVNSADALQILRYDVGKLTEVSPVSLMAGNVGGNDKTVNSADALCVLRFDVGKESFEW